MENIIDRIMKVDRREIDLIFTTALQRKRELYPDWEILYIAMPKEDNQERQDSINWIMNMLRKEQEGQRPSCFSLTTTLKSTLWLKRVIARSTATWQSPEERSLC